MRFLFPLLLFASAALPQDRTIKSPRGEIHATLHVAKQPNGTAVLIAPGQGYHKDLPLIVKSAEGLSAAGFTTLRFDWIYFTKKEQPSQNLENEIADVDAALAHLRGVEGVKRVLLAGKSLGSLVAMLRANKKSDDLAGLALLTYPIHGGDQPSKPWPGADRVTGLELSTLIVVGNRDPLCSLRPLYRLAGKCKRAPEIVIVPGDHSFREKGEGKTEENIALAVNALVVWAKRRLG